MSPTLAADIEIDLARKRALWTIEQAADECARTVKTLRNLISLHQLPVRRSWEVKNRGRRRTHTLTARTVARLVVLTRLAPMT